MAANPGTYGRPLKFNCAEAWAAALYMMGWEKEGKELLGKFGREHGFGRSVGNCWRGMESVQIVGRSCKCRVGISGNMKGRKRYRKGRKWRNLKSGKMMSIKIRFCQWSIRIIFLVIVNRRCITWQVMKMTMALTQETPVRTVTNLE